MRASGAVVALTVLMSSAAAANGQPAVLTLPDALTRASRANPDVLAAAAAVDVASARLDAAHSGFLPRVDVIETWQRGNAPLFAFSSLLSARAVTDDSLSTARLNEPDATAFFRAGLLIQQTVFDGLRTPRAIAVARLQRDLSEAAREARVHAVRLGVTRAYGAALVAGTLTRAAQAALDAAESDAARVTERRDAGLATDADVLALAVQVAEFRARLIRAEADASLAQVQLNRLIGAPPDERFDLSEPAVIPSASVDAATLDRQAQQARPDFRVATLAASVAHANRRLASSVFWPQITVQAGYEGTGRSFNDRRSSWLIGADIRWNLFSGGENRARVREASARLIQAEREKDALRGQVEESVRSAIRLLEAASAQDALGRATIAQAHEAERVTRERFEAGLATVTDLLRASTASLDAESRAAAARVETIIAAAELQYAVGQPVTVP